MGAHRDRRGNAHRPTEKWLMTMEQFTASTEAFATAGTGTPFGA